MNKLLIMALCAGGLLMSSCSSDEKVDAPRNTAEITFRATPNKLSRADYDVNNGNLDSIKVWGYNKDKDAKTGYQGALVFDGTTVTGSVGQNAWTYSPAV